MSRSPLYRDVTRESARHRATGEKLRRVLDGSPDVIVATDASGSITEFNRAAEDLTGCFSSEAVGRPLSEVLPDAVTAIDAGRKGKELLLTRPDGRASERAHGHARAGGGAPVRGQFWQQRHSHPRLHHANQGMQAGRADFALPTAGSQGAERCRVIA